MNQKRDVKTTIIAVGAAVAAGLVGVVLFILTRPTPRAADRISILGITALIAGASFLLGAFLGFLFGIPRTLQRAEEEAPRSATQTLGYRVNTNFEQISDWLTKIIVGVGLTQLGTLPRSFWTMSGHLSGAIGEPPAGQTVVAAVVLHFLLSGFFFGYLLTRLFLTGAFQRAERTVEEAVDQLTHEIEKVHSRTRALDVRVTEGEMFKALYEPAPGGFERVIELGEFFVKQNPDASAEVWGYLAAAYGQSYRWEMQHANGKEVLDTLRAKALDAVRRAVALNPGAKPVLAMLWRPEPGTPEDDLEPFRDDPEFEKTLT